MMTPGLWFLVAYFTLNLCIQISQIGKPREPKRAWEVITGIFEFTGVVLVAVFWR